MSSFIMYSVVLALAFITYALVGFELAVLILLAQIWATALEICVDDSANDRREK